MPTIRQRYREAVREYIGAEMALNGAKWRRRAERMLLTAGELLESEGLLEHQKSMTDAHVAAVYRLTSGGTPMKVYATQAFRSMLAAYGVRTRPLRVKRPEPNRPRIGLEDFLTIHRAARAQGDVQGATVLLLGSLTLRAVGMLRLRPQDVNQSEIIVRDKGRMDGAVRRIPITPSIWAQLQDYLDWRQQTILVTIERRPGASIPDSLLIQTRPRLAPMSYDTLLALCHRCGRRAGMRLSPHMLRRMACRELVQQCGGRLDVAMRISGHKDVQMLMDYAGETADEKRDLIVRMMEERDRMAEISKKRVNQPPASQ